MINYDVVTKESINKQNSNWSQIPVPPYRILIIGSSGSGKTNALLNRMKQQDDDDSIIDKVYLYLHDLNEANYQYLI